MNLETISVVLTIVTSTGGTYEAGYEELTQAQLTCAEHIEVIADHIEADGAEADHYCVWRFTSMRPRARPEGLGQ
jgi:hypothetical protein